MITQTGGTWYTRADYLDFNLKCLFYAGLWPNEKWSRNKQKIYKIYEVTLFIMSFTFMFITSIGIYMAKSGDTIFFFADVDKNIVTYNYIFKIIAFFTKRNEVKTLINYIIYSGDRITDQRKKLMVTHVIVVTGMILALTGVFQILALMKGELIIVAWFPFDPMKNQWSLFLAEQLLVILFAVPCVFRAISIQGIVCSIIMYICDQLTELQSRLKNLNYSVETAAETKEELKLIIKKHIRLMGYAQSLSYAFKEYFLIQNLAVTAEFGLNALMVSIVGADQKKHLLSFIAFLMLALVNAYIFCFLGNKLMDESTCIALAAYESSWISWPVSMQKDVLLIITVAQRSFKLTAGGMAYMSMQTFAQALYNGYSMFAVVRDLVN
ncbi:hypothetical protein evm_002661 [Chilo suppressalis]|nr:hypothetical protein evm_002661 [Chilo suppressalis]